MARSIPADYPGRSMRLTLTSFLWRQAKVIAGLCLLALVGLSVAALSTWNVLDPSYSNATAKAPANILGAPGSYFADLMMQFFGLGSVLALLPVFAWSMMMMLNVPVYRLPQRGGAWVGGSILASASLSCFQPPATWPIPNGLGGVFGDMILKFPALFLGAYPEGIAAGIVGALCAGPALGLLAFSSNLVATAAPVRVRTTPAPVMPGKIVRQPAPQQQAVREEEDDDREERDSPFAYLQGYAAHYWYSAQARLRRTLGLPARKPARRDFDEPYDLNDEEFGLMHSDRDGRHEVEEPVAERPAVKVSRQEPSMFTEPPKLAPTVRRVISRRRLCLTMTTSRRSISMAPTARPAFCLTTTKTTMATTGP